MTTKTKAQPMFDPKCHDLAAAFLSDEPAINTPEAVNRLAASIQRQIEDWISYERDHPGEA